MLSGPNFFMYVTGVNGQDLWLLCKESYRESPDITAKAPPIFSSRFGLSLVAFKETYIFASGGKQKQGSQDPATPEVYQYRVSTDTWTVAP